MALALWAAALASALAEEYTPPTPSGAIAFLETFQGDWASRWTYSQKEVYTGKFAAEPYKLDAIPGDVGLTMPAKAHRYGLTRKLDEPVATAEQPLVVQYEVSLKGGLECGGAYVKLLHVDASFDGAQFEEPTPYSIMFGPDKCANAGKVHFIFKFRNPVTGDLVEHHLRETPPLPPTAERVVQTHLYTFVLLPDNKLRIAIDNETAGEFSLLDDFDPPVNPPKQIDDPTDAKPADWVDERMVADPDARKPDDWDEDAPYQIADPAASKPEGWHDDAPEMIADPAATMPADWDSEEDGEWEAPLVKNPLCSNPGCGEWQPPMIANPAYKGKWYAPMVDNPAYKGEWKARQIDNPAFFEDRNPAASLLPIGAVGFELWTMDDGTLFDNVLITRDEAAARAYAEQTWGVRHAIEAKAKADALAAEDGPGDKLVDKAVFYANRAAQLAQDLVADKPVAVGIALFVGFLSLVLACCWPSAQKRAPPAPPPAAPAPPAGAGASSAAEPKAEPAMDAQAGAEPKASPKARATRRTPKAAE